MLGFGCQRESGVHAQVDMTDAQLAVARKYVDEYTQLLGYSQPNLSFRKGTIENLKEVSGRKRPAHGDGAPTVLLDLPGFPSCWAGGTFVDTLIEYGLAFRPAVPQFADALAPRLSWMLPGRRASQMAVWTSSSPTAWSTCPPTSRACCGRRTVCWRRGASSTSRTCTATAGSRRPSAHMRCSWGSASREPSMSTTLR